MQLSQIKRAIKKTTENAYVYSVVAKIISVITGLVYSVLYSRYLGSELRGTASIINNYSELIMLVLCFGVYQAYPYFKKTKTTGEDRYMEFINRVFGMFFVYLAISIFAVLALDLEGNARAIMILIPLLVAIKQLNYVVLIENPRLRNTAQIWLDIFDVVLLIVLMIFTTASYFYCIFFLIAKNIVCLIIAIANLKVPLSSIRPTLKGIMPYIRYGFVPMITLVLMEVNYKVDVLMLEWMGVATAEIGVYSLGVMLAQKMWLIPDALKDILVSKLAGGKQEDEVCKVTRISLWVMIVCVIGLVIFGKPLIWLLFGNEYAGAYSVVLVIMLGVVGMVFYKMIYSYNVVNGHKNLNLILLGSAAAINVVMNYLSIPIMGILGAAFASTVSYFVCGVLFLLTFSRITKSKVRDLIFLKKQDIDTLKRFIKR